MVPVLWWAAWEFSRAGVAVAGAAFLLLLALSPFLVDNLTLTHSGVGFHLISIVAIATLAVYAVFSPRVTARGLIARAAAAGVVLGVSAFCRTGSFALLPGFVLAAVLGVRRIEVGTRIERTAWLALAILLLVAPYAMLRQRRQHDVWIAIWEGLGDFDRTKGHYWTDEEVNKALSAAGLPAGKEPFAWVTDESEAFFRREVLRDIRSDPGWYGRILLRRVWATVSQEKVRAWGTRDWRWIRDQLAPNEGGMGKYYSWMVPANSFGFGRARVAVPIGVLVLPTLGLLVLSVPRVGRGRFPSLASSAGKSVAVLACLAAGAITVPVAITTASLPETQAFALVYVLGIALLIDGVVRQSRL
jgi:hypothetical protein